MILKFPNKIESDSPVRLRSVPKVIVASQDPVLDDLSKHHQHIQKLADRLVDQLEVKDTSDDVLEKAANVLTAFGHMCKNDRKVRLQECLSQVLALLGDTYPGVGSQINVDIENSDILFTESILLVFLYNLLRPTVEALTPHAVLRLSVRFAHGKLKGFIKVDGLKAGLEPVYKIVGSSCKTEVSSLNPRKMDEQSLVEMMTDAGHQVQITHFSDSSTVFDIYLSNFIDLNMQADNVALMAQSG